MSAKLNVVRSLDRLEPVISRIRCGYLVPDLGGQTGCRVFLGVVNVLHRGQDGLLR